MERGGKTVYGATVGILMLETQFPRVHGDVGNALTWDFPVQYRVVEGASPDRVVRNDPSDLAERFIEAGHDLIRTGCDGITTTCGFLSLIQEEVKSALGVPVATSSLMQVPMVQSLLPAGKR
ncbi:MAG: aspartate/glutamate racemase family protein, partial [Pseudomonadota bacterium]|nr:aspartate/glutamate racemase family protein [Pseudomonadota bacterium]